jgi:hypothetical protein
MVEKHIQISFNDENQLPSTLAAAKQLNTWRIACPHCRESALLAENEGVFELLKLTFPLVVEKKLSPADVVVVVLLCLALVGVSIYSLVHFFMR